MTIVCDSIRQLLLWLLEASWGTKGRFLRADNPSFGFGVALDEPGWRDCWMISIDVVKTSSDEAKQLFGRVLNPRGNIREELLRAADEIRALDRPAEPAAASPSPSRFDLILDL